MKEYTDEFTEVSPEEYGKLDLTKILKRGNKLYSTLHGEVIFNRYNKSNNSIYCTCGNDDIVFDVITDKYGRDSRKIFILFPSKENRDWSTYNIKPKIKPEPNTITVELTKSDLVAMVVGKTPGYSNIQRLENLGLGRFWGGMGESWDWDIAELHKLHINKLYELYKEL